MRVRHLTQRGRSIGESKSSVKDEVMRLTLIRRELDTLGHRQLPKNRTVIAKRKSGTRFSSVRDPTVKEYYFRNPEPDFISKVLWLEVLAPEALFLARHSWPLVHRTRPAAAATGGVSHPGSAAASRGRRFRR